jgi:hypothetical protein
MPDYNPALLQMLIGDVDRANSAQAKGDVLAELIKHVFAMVPGVGFAAEKVKNRFQSQEVDIAFWNDQHPHGLKQFEAQLLIECKNWSAPVTAMEVCWFLCKLERRALEFGVLVALHGITGAGTEDWTAAHEIAGYYQSKGIRLAVLTRRELEALRSTDDLVNLLKAKLNALVVGQRLHAG